MTRGAVSLALAGVLCAVPHLALPQAAGETDERIGRIVGMGLESLRRAVYEPRPQ